MVGSVLLALFISLGVHGSRALPRLATGWQEEAGALPVPAGVSSESSQPKNEKRWKMLSLIQPGYFFYMNTWSYQV